MLGLDDIIHFKAFAGLGFEGFVGSRAPVIRVGAVRVAGSSFQFEPEGTFTTSSGTSQALGLRYNLCQLEATPIHKTIQTSRLLGSTVALAYWCNLFRTFDQLPRACLQGSHHVVGPNTEWLPLETGSPFLTTPGFTVVNLV